MPEPLREQALARFIARLQAMTGIRPWGGTYANPPGVARVLPLALTGIPQFPHLVVTERSGSAMTPESTAGGALADRHDLRVTVVGYVQGTDEIPRSRWLQRLWDDVWRTVAGQVRPLDALEGCRSVEIEGECLFDDGELGERVGVFAQGYLITLDEILVLA
jgi:hypothetical protein